MTIARGEATIGGIAARSHCTAQVDRAGPEADYAPQNYLLTLFAASIITANTSFGLESIAT
jgi:hypothetical protein